MADLLKSNPTALRHCILFEVLQGTSIKEAYSKFCRTIGNDFMEYREFDFWYYRFLNGEYDPNFERDKNKKTYELSDMPIVVMEKIVGKLDIFDRISLAKTSQSFRTFVENQKLFHHTLRLDITPYFSLVSFDDSLRMEYTKKGYGCGKGFKGNGKRIFGVPHWKQSLLDIKSVLKNPKLHLDTFDIRMCSKEMILDDLETALKFIHQLNVRKLSFQGESFDTLLKVLPSMKPGYLTSLHIYESKPESIMKDIEEIVQMEQWKQAKYLDCTPFVGSLRNLFHFKRFDIYRRSLTIEDIRQMKEKKFNDKENPCAKYLRDDKYALRVCILYESLKYQKDKSSVPIFEVFVNFCKVIGVEDVLKYPEFEFWFYQFLNGDCDLNYERNEEKKIYELMDMPIDVMKNVVEYLDIFDRFKLAKTSRSLQTFVEDQKLFLHTLELRISLIEAIVSISDSVGCKRIFKDPGRRARHVDHWKQALLDFKSIIKNPKLHFDTLEIVLYTNDEHVFNDLEDALKFTHHLNVKHLIYEEFSTDLLMKVLPSLKPGYLKTIDMISYNPNPDSMDTVFEMEQWKQAKCFYMAGNFIWPLHHLYHFVYFQVFLIELSVEDVCQMKEILLKSPNFEKCLIIVDDDTGVHAIEEVFGDYIQQEENTSNDSKIYHYPIPNSSEYFNIDVKGFDFEITRKKR